MYRLRSLFGRYWALYLASVVVIGSVAVTVLVQIFRFANGPAQWFFNYISKWTVASSAFNFIIDWAETLSIAAAISVVIAVLMEIRETRRKRALIRIHNWARDAIVKLTSDSREISVAKRLADWKQQMMIIRIESGSVLADARAFGDCLESKVNKAVTSLLEFDDYLNGSTERTDAKTALETTVSAFIEVINQASDSPNHSH